MSSNYFSRINSTSASNTGTGLDQIVDTIGTDFGLSGRISDKDIAGGSEAANAMNAIIVEAVNATGVASNGIFSVSDVRAINAYIRANHKEEWSELHGDDENGEETGFHLVQNDGATSRYRGDNLANTVADGIYHLGFQIQGNRLLNEDGNANATLTQAAEWLTQFYTDRSTTQSGLDRATDMIMADRGLDRRISDQDIADGADAANGMSTIIKEAIESQGLANDGVINVADIRQINSYIRDNYQDEWVILHGDDENGEETGFHLVQNDGANTRMFGQNFVNTVADGIFHLGFQIQGNNILNEDGDANATLTDLADWVNYFYVDQGTTNTGLDELVQAIKSDEGLSRNTNAGDINGGAEAANGLNALLVKAIKATGAATDNLIDIEDVKAINQYLQENHKQEWKDLHGDDERDEETGFHLVQNDGSNIKYRGDNLVNTVIDGLYHLGFKIKGDNVLNEDGNNNANLGDLATWLNNFYLNEESTFGSQKSDRITGLNHDDKIWARDGNDLVIAGDGDDFADGGNGNDRLIGGNGNDTLIGAAGNDRLEGGNGNDVLDAGDGNDLLIAGTGNDKLDAGAGNDRLIGGDGNDELTASSGNNRLEGQDGNDSLVSGAGKDLLIGGKGDDKLDSGAGNDRLIGGDGNDELVTSAGNNRLEGGNGDDTLTSGAGKDLLIGGRGDDKLDSGAGNDRLYGGDGDDELVTSAGNNRLEGGNGDDTLTSGAGKDLLIGGNGEDKLDSGAGDDRLYGGNNNDILLGKDGNDRLEGGNGNDILVGGAGNDFIIGGSDEDTLVDGAGADRMYGGSGNDKLYSWNDNANDQLDGGAGADEFLFLASGQGIGTDKIRGFSSNQGDKLIIGGENVEFNLIQLRGNHTRVELSANNQSMGSIDVYGQLTAADIQLDEDAFANITSDSWAEIA
ncbi:MAG: hypothetical protein GQ532_16530 [Methylomarinum sp.]|nr:hypothetical protein [Methylomarinum sp.]